MRCCASLLACVAAVPVAARSVLLSPAELSSLEGEDGCAAAEWGSAECSVSLLQYRMTRMSIDPAHEAADDDQIGGSDSIDDVSQGIDTMSVAVAKLFALESGVEDGGDEQQIPLASPELAIDKMVQDIKDKVEVTADGIKEKLEASSNAAEAIRKMSEAVAHISMVGSSESVDEGIVVEPSANSQTDNVALQSWKSPPKMDIAKVGQSKSAASASSVNDIVNRADQLADTLKEVTKAQESDSKHPEASSSAKTLQALNETIGNIKAKAGKIAAKLEDAAEPEDNGESTSKLKGGHDMQHLKFGNSAINTSSSRAVRHLWRKSLDDMVGTSDESHQHSKTKVASESSNDMGRTSEEGQKHANQQFAARRADINSAKAEADDEEQHGRAKPSHETAGASLSHTSVKRDGHHIDSEQHSQHDKKSDDIESHHSSTKSSAASDSFTAHSHAVNSVKMKASGKSSQHDGGDASVHRQHSFAKHSEVRDTINSHSDSVISVKMEKLEDDVDDADDKLCGPGRVIDFGAAKVIHSNLGGAGPDKGEENLVYQGVAGIDGSEVNLVVTVLSSYTPYNAQHNGLAGVFGQINLQVDTKVDLSFKFVYSSGGADAPMDGFYFSFVDLDQGMAPLSEEKVTIKGFESYRLSEDTEVLFKARGEDTATFSSSWRGGKVDNPGNPMSMNKLERDRTVTAVFPSNTSKFEARFEEKGYAAVQGRNFMFSGVSDLVCAREQKCALYTCPEGFHLRQRAEFLVCAGRQCSAEDRDLCCFAEASM